MSSRLEQIKAAYAADPSTAWFDTRRLHGMTAVRLEEHAREMGVILPPLVLAPPTPPAAAVPPPAEEETSPKEMAAKIQALADAFAAKAKATTTPPTAPPTARQPAIATAKVKPPPTPRQAARVGRYPKMHTPTTSRRLSLEIYNQDFYAVPRSLTWPILLAMPKIALAGYLRCCDEADSDGVFALSAKVMGKTLGKTERTGRQALTLLKEAGLITLLNSGGDHTASIYRLAPFAAVDPDRAIAALTGFRQDAAARLDALVAG